MEQNVNNSINTNSNRVTTSESVPDVGHDVCGNGPNAPNERSGGQVFNGRTNSTAQLQSLGVQLYSGPKNPDMGPIDTRKASFINRGWSDRVPVSTDRLAEAGFYYIGTIDAVKCFHCDLGLAHWEEGDDPWVEHAKKTNNCNFLKMNKNKSFLDECKRLENESPEPEESAGEMAVCRVIDELMTTDLVKEFISLNLFPIDLIKVALNRRYYSTKKHFDSFADMYDAVSALAEASPSSRQSMHESNPQTDNQLFDVIELKPTPPSSQQSNDENMSNEGTSGQSSSSNTISTSKSIEMQPKTSFGKESKKPEPNEENQLLCKLCYLAEIEVVFLACGHQLACTQCAQRLTNCPVCRQPIQGYVRTFFS